MHEPCIETLVIGKCGEYYKKEDNPYDDCVNYYGLKEVYGRFDEEIEEMNILNATMLAMKRAVEGLPQKADFAMIDGNRLPELSIDREFIVKGDAKSMSIACASILAKVSRDRLLYEYAKEYPQYHFDKHKGYGTKLHVEALREFGPCPYHRMSFLGKILK